MREVLTHSNNPNRVLPHFHSLGKIVTIETVYLSRTIYEPLPSDLLNAASDKIFIFIGLPGSGKQAQGYLLSTHLALPFISVGRLLRDAAKDRLSLSLIDRNKVALRDADNDRMLSSIIRKRTTQPDCTSGFILNGYPTDLRQAQSIDQWAAERHHQIVAIIIKASLDHLVPHLIANRICADCCKMVDPFLDSERNAAFCDLYCHSCGGEFISRANESYEESKRRLQTYASSIASLTQHYQTAGPVIEIDGRDEDKQVFLRLMAEVLRILS